VFHLVPTRPASGQRPVRRPTRLVAGGAVDGFGVVGGRVPGQVLDGIRHLVTRVVGPVLVQYEEPSRAASRALDARLS
jgi:hypothetical protein